jgi:hypothetical protein
MSSKISEAAFDEFAVLLTASVMGDAPSVIRAVLEPEVPLSQVLLTAVTACISLLSNEAHDLDQEVEDILPSFIEAMRLAVVAQ